MSCSVCNRRALPCSTRCGEFKLSQITQQNGGSLYAKGSCGSNCDGRGNGHRNIDIGGVVVKYASTPGLRFSCPPGPGEPCGCPTMSYFPQSDKCRPQCDSACGETANFCCPDPCRPRMKPCHNSPCCRCFPTFPKACCPCCWRPDPGMRKKCFYPQPICPPPPCSKLCLVPKHCSTKGDCCPPILVCPNCPPYTYPKGPFCGQKVPTNPSCKKPNYSGCPSICCPRPPFGLVPCDGTKCQDNYCCPKPIAIALDCPFRTFPSNIQYS